MGFDPKEEPSVPHTSRDANLRHGQAIAAQYVAYLLQSVIVEGLDGDVLVRLLKGARTVSGADPQRHTILGCAWILNIALAFGLELSLKAMLAKKGRKYSYTHNLVRLFHHLPDETQQEIEAKFREIVESDVAFRELLDRHQDDFKRWRYLDEPGNTNMGEVFLLQMAICAVLDVFDSA